MTKLSLGQAAKHAQRSKGTISKALNNGNLSGSKVKKNGRDTWEIEPSELERWMHSNPLRNVQEVRNTTPTETVGNDHNISALETEVKLLREMLTKTEQDRDKWQAIADKQTDTVKLLTHQDNQPSQPQGLFSRAYARLFG